MADCDSNPSDCETNVFQDPGNCGTCKKSCLGGDCKNGSCLPITIASNVGFAGDIALDAKFIYWTTDKEVMRAPTAGGAPEVLVGGGSGYSGIAVDAQSLYFTQAVTGPGQATGIVWKLPLSGGAPMQLASGQAFPVRIEVKGNYLIWTNTAAGGGGGSVMRSDLNGSNLTEIDNNGAGPNPFAFTIDFNDDRVFWTNQSDGTIRGALISGGFIGSIAEGEGLTGGI
ncbi:MAG: hypothetical protein L6Q76_04970, partial [Polyangiaceae bacterium]|nr:hypothetical protein [Polyangiaceae bacterium]